jgi:RNA polymerase sigma factor (sigma-70 family)
MPSYLRKHNDVEFFNAEEEAQLWRQAQDGDQEARAKLITSMLPYAITRAKKHGYRGIDLDDLIQVANIAIIKAVDDGFDPEKGRLTTYITRKIFWEIDRYIKDNYSTIRVPNYTNGKPSDKFSGITNQIIERGVQALPRDWDVPIADREPTDKEDLERLRKAINDLPDERIKEVIKSRLRGETLKEIGKRIGVTREWIRQLEIKGIRQLRATLMS